MTNNITGIQTPIESIPKLNIPTDNQPQINNNPTTKEELDQDVVRMAKAIRQKESGNKQVIPGEGSSVGGASLYQYTHGTWKDVAKRYLGDENALMTPENENQASYKRIKEWKDKGYNIGQIASMWNAGEGEPNAYLGKWEKTTSTHKAGNPSSGTNEYGIPYDVPGYAKKIAEEYQKLKSEEKQNTNIYQTSPAPIPQSSISNETIKPGEETLGSQLQKRAQDLAKTWEDTGSGKINPFSTGVQTIGTGLGAVADIVNKGLENTPVIGWALKGIEKIIGKGAQNFLNTEPGQAVAQSLNEFSTKHPEISKDIKGGLDIATALPILKGFRTVKNAVLDASAKGLKGWAENSVKKDLVQAVNKTVAGRDILSKNPGSIKTLITEQAIPDISREGNSVRYSTQKAFDKLGEKISNIEDNQLQPLLRQASTQGINTKVPIESIRNNALKDIVSEFKSGGNVGKAKTEVNRIFDDYKGSYGDYISLEDLNDMKRGIRGTVNFNSPKLESDVSYQIGQVFQHTIEKSAKKLGLDDVNAINKSMAELIKAQNVLKVLNGKSVAQGLIGKTLRTGSVAIGESLGRATGIPFAGSLGAYQAGNIAANKIGGGLAQAILKRTINPVQNVKGKIGGMLGSAIAQKQLQK